MDVKLIPETKPIQKIKVTVLGRQVTGKSSLTYRFINYNTPVGHDATIEDKYKTVVEINGKTCEIEILDTAGQEDYQGMLDMWINFAEGILLVYAINDREGFESLQKKRDKILKLKKGIKCPILLVGNKCDLESERQVPVEEAKEMARQWGVRYIETSATECFYELTKQIVTSNGNGDEVQITGNKCCKMCNIF